MHQFFYRLYVWISNHKLISVFFALIFLLVGFYFASKIQLEDDITKVLPKNEKSNITSKVFQQQQFSDKITVIIEKKENSTSDDLISTADILIDSLSRLDSHISSIQGISDEEFLGKAFDFVYQNLPLYLDENDYQLVNQKINQDSIHSILEKNLESLTSPSGVVTRDFILKDPLGLSFIALKKMQKAGGLTDLNYQNGYVFTKDESKLLLFIDPKYKSGDTKNNEEFVKELNLIKEKINKDISHTEISYFGAPIIAVANANQIKTDIMKTVLISMSVLMIMLMFFYRQILTPIIIFIPTIFGILSALMLMYFLRNSLSAISLSIGAVLLGITIDYSLHVMTHYKKNQSIKILFREITRPVLMSCITTAVAFVCLVFVHSEALIDLGIFAFVTVLMSGFFTLIFIPHLYHPRKGALQENKTIVEKIAKINYENKWLFLGSLLLILISLFTFNRVKFNENIADLNFVPADQLVAEQKLAKSTSMMQKSVYLVNYADNLDDALIASKKLENELIIDEKNNQITDYSSIANLVLSQNEQKVKRDNWTNFWTENKKSQLKALMIKEGDDLGFVPETYQEFYNLIDKEFQTISYKDYLKFDASIFKEFINEKNGLFTVSTLVKLDENKRNKFVENYNESKEIVVIDRKNLNETFLGNLVKDFNSLINYSTIAILLILWFFFKRLELVLVSFIPIALTGFVTAGLMGLFHVEFNIFSSIVCTLVFGHGVDFTIFMTSALQKEYTTGQNEQKTYKTSILLAVITTILAIGALIFAKHPALRSISSVALIGVCVAVLITFVFYPPIFKFFFFNRPKKGYSPVSLGLVFQTLVLFFYFLFFGMILNILVAVLMIILPISKEKKVSFFDWILTKFMWTVPYLNPFVKKKIVNLDKRNNQQTIFISNHSSSLDIPMNKILSPKSIFVVNDWVYNSPIYGKAIRAAGFFPVSKGLENSIENLDKRISDEFSVIIYPEGTRSETNSIRRFHKGAFYLADQMQLPIQPIFLLGNADVWPKNEIIIFDGNLISVIGESISPNDKRFGETYSERTRKISQHFKAQYQELRYQYEDENYFRNKLFLSFLYKEPEIVKEMKLRFEQNKFQYHQLNFHLPIDTTIFRIGNDLGELDFLLLMQQAKRKVFTFITDQEKRAIAKTNYLTKKRFIRYVDKCEIPENVNFLILDNESQLTEIPNHILEIIIMKSIENQTNFPDFTLKLENEYFRILKRNP